jgi:hypothetical protein
VRSISSSIFLLCLSTTDLPLNHSAPKAGSPEELTLAIRLFGSRDIALGLLLRDSASAVVERAVQIGFVSSGLDLAATAFGFIEGTISTEVSFFSSLCYVTSFERS